MSKKALHSKRVVVEGKLQEATVFIENDKIISVKTGKVETEGFESFGDSVLMPGLIDSHVHINEPGRTDWEGFDTATKAAAAGGITMLVDMPLNSHPVTVDIASFKEKIEASKGKLHVNCGFWGGIVPYNINELETLIDAGVLGIKAFLTHSGIKEFPHVEKNELLEGMKIMAKKNVPILAHCELDEKGCDKELADNPTSYKAYLNSRPKHWEDNAIKMMINLAQKSNCHTHVVHLSSANGIELIKNAQENNIPITTETCSHYLFFNAEEIPDGKTVYKCAPPIREKANNDKLWQGIKNGIIDFVITDHSPATPEIKELETGNYKKAWGGIAGLQFSLPAVWKKGETQGLSIVDVSNIMSKNVAKFLKLDKIKGKIAQGYDADLVVWNPEKDFVSTNDEIHHKHKISPYVGYKLKGEVLKTYVNGNLVYNQGTFEKLNNGKIILRNGK